jgi:hypothetical protein
MLAKHQCHGSVGSARGGLKVTAGPACSLDLCISNLATTSSNTELWPRSSRRLQQFHDGCKSGMQCKAAQYVYEGLSTSERATLFFRYVLVLQPSKLQQQQTSVCNPKKSKCYQPIPKLLKHAGIAFCGHKQNLLPVPLKGSYINTRQG